MKNIDLQNLEIVENYPDFNPNDLDEIVISNNLATKEILDKSSSLMHYKVLRTLDYYSFAKINGKVVGTLRAYTDRDSYSTTWLESILVHKDYQGQGIIGTALMKAFLKKYAHTTIWTMVNIEKHKQSLDFFKKFNYKDNSHNFSVCTRWRNKEPIKSYMDKKEQKDFSVGSIKNFTIMENCPYFQAKDVNEMLLSVGWHTQELIDKIPDSAVYKSSQEMDYCVCAFDENQKIVGELRAYTDRDSCFTTLLESILVHKDYQGQGIAGALMEAFHNRYAHTTIWNMTPIKNNKKSIEFLKKFGYKDNSKLYVVCTRKREV